MRASRSIELPDAPDRVWELLVDWEHQVSWIRDADAVRVVTPERGGVGVRLEVRTRIVGVPAFVDLLEVTGWTPPRRLEVAHRRVVSGTGTWQLEPSAFGTTFTWSEDIHLPIPLVGGVLLAAYRPVLRWLMGRSLQGLRRYVIAAGPA